MHKLTLLMITRNADKFLEASIQSINDICNEIVIIDTNSSDQTKDIALKYNAKFFNYDGFSLGKKRLFGLKKTSNEWVIVLDADEIISNDLKNEIKAVLRIKKDLNNGYYIPYKNHFLNRRITYGGESYKMIRLFKKSKVNIELSFIHEKFSVEGRVGVLQHHIIHYSYQTLTQTYKKFTAYALRTAYQKIEDGERTNLKKILLYPPHMFWARFVTDRGYKDGFFRLPLDVGFAYMEFVTYVSMLFIKNKK